jgi:hypothetical protein
MAASLRNSSVAERPASMSTLLAPASTYIELPLLPLASRQTRTFPPCLKKLQSNFIQETGGRFKVKLV